ncbi:hypothetical protein BZA70DRAFT_267727 [Myxozyma melibiosi]|uniref:ubiquitinyl hydrolase 1 n=1 Tax=Myxozyma melibiosi TaxID=54550 RepID=A0ABR1F5U9_9ASCO
MHPESLSPDSLKGSPTADPPRVTTSAPLVSPVTGGGSSISSGGSATTPGSPSQLSTTSSVSVSASTISVSTNNKRPLAESGEDLESQSGSPRVRVLDDAPSSSDDLLDDGQQSSYARPVPIRLGMTEGDQREQNFDDSADWYDESPKTAPEESPDKVPKPETVREQIAAVLEACNVTVKEGESWYIVSDQWWNSFVNATDDATIESVDNSDLFDAKGVLIRDTEFQIIPATAWAMLTEWYGHGDSTYEIERTAVNTTDEGSNVEVELFPPVYSLYHLPGRSGAFSSDSSVATATMSRTNKLSELYDAARESLDIRSDIVFRIWKLNTKPLKKFKMDVEKFQAISDKELIESDDMNTRLGDLGLGMDLALVVDEQLANKEWVSDRKPTTTVAMRNNTHGPRVPPRRNVNNQHDDSRPKGMTGLANLGNTCYMNSALQCLTHVEELTKYFLLDAYKDELNPTNPLGMDGKVATAYSDLVHKIFQSKPTLNSFTPREMKGVIGRYGPMFSGYGQHDSQEFVAFLLDGLHEDLNRILKKPYTEKPELPDDKVESKEAVVELAHKCWELHRMRNDSVIQDLFAGMYKSTLVCPECKKVSITFDPYMDLTLPLPIDNSFSRNIVYVPAKGLPMTVGVEMNSGSSVKEFKQYIASRVGTDPNRLILATIYSHKMYGIPDDHEIAAAKLESDDSVVYELDQVPQEPDYSDVMIFPVVNRIEKDPNVRYASSELFGYPFLITLTPAEASSYDVIYSKIIDKYKCMSTNKTLQSWGVTEDGNDAAMPHAVGSPQCPSVFKVAVTAGSTYRRYYAKNTIPTVFSVEATIDIKERYDRAHYKPEPYKSMIIDDVEDATPAAVDDAEAQSSTNDSGLDGLDVVPLGQSIESLDPNQSSMGLEAPTAEFEGETEADENWLSVRASSSDIEMQDASDKEDSDTEAGARVAELDEDDEVMPTVEDLFENSEEQQATSTQWNESEGEKGGFTYVTMGETIVCDWTRDAYETCFGATDDSDSMRGRATWETMPLFESDDVKQIRETRNQKRTQDITLDDCLDLFSKPEVLGEDDLWYCPRCKKHQQAIKTFEIWKVPEIFTVHLKRFSSTSRRDKIDVKIDFPVEGLDLSDRVGDPEQSQNPEHLIYDLIAVDNHFGGLGGGHYTANVKNFVDNKWYYFDDSSVREVSPESGVTEAAYLLFYRRRSSNTLGGEKLHQILSSDEDPLAPKPSKSASTRSKPPSSSAGEEASSSLPSPPPYTEFVGPLAPPAPASGVDDTKDISSRFPGEGRMLGNDISYGASTLSTTAWPASARPTPNLNRNKPASDDSADVDDVASTEVPLDDWINTMDKDQALDVDPSLTEDDDDDDDDDDEDDVATDVSGSDQIMIPSEDMSIVGDDVVEIKPAGFRFAGDDDEEEDESVTDIRV